MFSVFQWATALSNEKALSVILQDPQIGENLARESQDKATPQKSTRDHLAAITGGLFTGDQCTGAELVTHTGAEEFDRQQLKSGIFKRKKIIRQGAEDKKIMR